MQKIELLASWIKESKRIVFFGGAGTSTESGIPDFRSAAGIYRTRQQFPYAPEEMLSRSFFDHRPEIFYEFYRSKMIYPNARPNPVHLLLARLEREGKLKAVITQNIDGLHQMAGSGHVLELHGSIHRNYCTKCHRYYSLDHILHSKETIPTCEQCGAIIKPDVVLYGENLDEDILGQTIEVISAADLFIVGGTSLTVQPAAHLITYFRDERMAILNTSPTPYDQRASLLITEPMGQVMAEVDKLV
ncbi:NAD-dependent protein deacylase [Paenibacillus sediminis]|uniref:NAD-dependent protein deacetylase n=1 Tax=Paenibacillus sediminis TaxID=664909 RepID=A0ABS4GYT8_9BACL|nr:NAD-dependent deacetylase [Paenibacillus sediminis]